MAEREEGVGSVIESVKEKMEETLHSFHSSSSSDSDDDKKKPSVPSAVYRLFGRQQPVHKVLGGGKPADIFMWRNKKISAGLLGGVTLVWLLFEWLGYYLITLVCHGLILSLAILFVWSNAASFVNKAPPKIHSINIPEDIVVSLSRGLTIELNRALVLLHDVALGRDLKKFLGVIAVLWILSVVGSWCNFLTLFYIAFVTLHTVPVLYEKYEDQIDSAAEKAGIEIKKQYAVFDAKVLSKIPKGPLKEKKF
ncbi:unnamed protein product [Victoria cruziana]